MMTHSSTSAIERQIGKSPPPKISTPWATPEQTGRLIQEAVVKSRDAKPLTPDTSGKRLTVFVSVDADIGGCADLGEYWDYDVVYDGYKYHGELITADGHVYRWHKRVDTESAGNPVHTKMLRQEALAAIFQTARKEGRI